MTAVTNLPLIIHALKFFSEQNDDFKIERPYLEERWLIEWRKKPRYYKNATSKYK
jgi:hypothetical protein